jgi:hypothetical protein
LENISFNDCLIATCFLGQYFDYFKNVFDTFKKFEIEEIKRKIPSFCNNKINIQNLININICSPKTTYIFLDSNGGGNKSFTIDEKEHTDIESRAGKLLEEFNQSESSYKNKVELEFSKAFNDNLANKGDFGVIKEIVNKSKPVIYEKYDMRKQIFMSDKNPFDYVYNVDVEVIYCNNVDEVKLYKIKKLNGIIGKNDFNL